MARLVIHCGLHKAGSTSIQHLLRANSENLPENVKFVPRGGLPPFKLLVDACRDFDMRSQAVCQQRITKIFQALLELVPHGPDDTLLLSSEDFVGAMPLTRQAKPLYFKAAGVLNALAKAGNELGHDVEFVLCLRQKESWIRSWHNHQLLWRARPLSWDELNQRPNVIEFHPEALAYALRRKVPAPIHIIRFEDEVASPCGPGAGLLRVAGLNDDQMAGIHAVPIMQRTPRPWVFRVAQSRIVQVLPVALRTSFKAALVRLDRRLRKD